MPVAATCALSAVARAISCFNTLWERHSTPCPSDASGCDGHEHIATVEIVRTVARQIAAPALAVRREFWPQLSDRRYIRFNFPRTNLNALG